MSYFAYFYVYKMAAICVHVIYTFILVVGSKSSTTNKRKSRRSLWLHKPKKSKQNVQMNSVSNNIHFQKTPTCINEHPTTSSITHAKCKPKRRRRQLFEDNTHGTYLNHEYERCNAIIQEAYTQDPPGRPSPARKCVLLVEESVF